MSQEKNAANEELETLNAQNVKLGAGVSKWSFLIRMLPCVPGMVVPDLYALAERRADQVSCANRAMTTCSSTGGMPASSLLNPNAGGRMHCTHSLGRQ